MNRLHTLLRMLRAGHAWWLQSSPSPALTSLKRSLSVGAAEERGFELRMGHVADSYKALLLGSPGR